MLDPQLGPEQPGAGTGHRGVGLARDIAAARARRQVDHHVLAGGADALDHLAVVADLHARAAVRLADMDVGDGGAGGGGLDRGIRWRFAA